MNLYVNHTRALQLRRQCFCLPCLSVLRRVPCNLRNMPHSATSRMLRPARSFGLPVNGPHPRAFQAIRASQVVSAASTTKRGNPVRQPREENVAGDFYVDHTCIDCDTCRWMDPETYGRVGNMSAVVRQPETPEDLERAMQALITCPT